MNLDTLWADELACWKRAQATWDLLMLATRARVPRALATTTPRRLAILKRILGESSTVQTTDTTYANRSHLAPEFLGQIVALYENTRLGRQEIYAEMLEVSEGIWFTGFNPTRHVSVEAEYHPGFPVRCAIDAGTSRHTGAVFFQALPTNAVGWPRIRVFGDYHGVDLVSEKNAVAIKKLADELPCRGQLDLVRLDPASAARSSLGPAAYGEYERIFGSRFVARWPQHQVLDGLETIELLLDAGALDDSPPLHAAHCRFQQLCPQEMRGGEWLDFPADGHPEEDMMDALRGGLRDYLPSGRPTEMSLRSVHARRLA